MPTVSSFFTPARKHAAALISAAALGLLIVVPVQAATTPGVWLENYTWMELRDAVAAGSTTAIIPIGGVEQSGPAIALGKHNLRVHVLAERIAEQLGHTIVAPVVAYVPEGGVEPTTSHMRFPGTITVPDDAFQKMLESVADSLRVHGFRNIVFLGDHGGYKRSVERVAAQLNKRWAGKGAHAIVPAAYYQTSSDGFSQMLRQQGFADSEIGTHAGLADAALQMAVAPASVRGDQLHGARKPGPADGVYGGDPRRATAALGEPGVQAIVAKTVAEIKTTLRAEPAGR